MAEVMKVLAQGQLATSTAALYTVPGATTGLILTAEFLNVSVSAVTIDLFINGTAAANQIKQAVTLAAGESFTFDGKMFLAATNTFQGKASAATAVTYTLMGMEIN